MRKIGYTVSISIFTLLYIAPLIIVLSNARIETIAEIIKDPYYIHTIFFTFKQALLSALLSIIIGLPGAYIITRYEFKFRKIVKLLYYIPFVLPSILVVLGFVTAYGKNGLINKILNSDIKILYSFTAVMLAHVFYNFPVVISIVSSKWESLDGNIENEARSSGASEFVIFKKITFPRLISSILTSALLVFLFCFTSFAIILVLGGGTKLTTIEVEIYRQARTSLNIGNASSLSLISLLVVSIFAFLYTKILNRNSLEESSYNSQIKLSKAKTFSRILVHAYLILTVLFLTLPLLGIFFKVIPTNIFKEMKLIAFFNTFLIGVSSAVVTIILSVFLCSKIRNAKNNVRELILTLPMATSSVILGLGYFITTKYFKYIPDFILLMLCHGVLNVPYAVKNILPVYNSMPLEQVESAQLEGLNDSGILMKIELPYIKDSILSAFTFCFALSCGELNATVMIASGKYITIPLQIQRMISAYNYNGACVAGFELIVMCCAVYLICERLRDR